MAEHNKIAVLAGGCFWGMEDLFRRQRGVVSTRVGYTGGDNKHPTYRYHPGHAEALEITYDPDETDYRALLEFFFQIHDPTTRTVRETMSEPVTGRQSSIWTKSKSRSLCAPSPTSRVPGDGPAQSSPRSTRPTSFGRRNPSTRTIYNATHPATPATTSGPSGHYRAAVTMRGQRWRNMQNPRSKRAMATA
jgi:methionine-S-sulfoxide reductase